MRIHSPAGGACAGHGGGLSPSDPPSSVLALSGVSGGTWGTQRLLGPGMAPVLVPLVCFQALQSQCNPQKQGEKSSYSQITLLVYIKPTHFLNAQQLEGVIAPDEAEEAPACDGF